MFRADAWAGRGGRTDAESALRLPGERVLLRDFEPSDAAAFGSYRADSRYREFHPPGLGGPDEARVLLDGFAAAARMRPRRDFQLAITDVETRALIGCAELRATGLPAGYAEHGIELSPPHWGRGLAAEAAGLLLSLGFESLGLEEIRCVSVTENVRAGRLLARLGFVRRRVRRAGPWLGSKVWTLTDWSLTRAAWYTAPAAAWRAESLRGKPDGR